MLGLVPGPGWVLGVGLVVLGVSVPMPPAFEPGLAAPPDDSPGMPEDELPDDEAPPEDSGDVEPVELPDAASEGIPDDEPLVLLPRLPEGVVVELLPELMSELLPGPLPEPPPVMPVHAPSSTAHAMGNIHVVIEHSRFDQ